MDSSKLDKELVKQLNDFYKASQAGTSTGQDYQRVTGLVRQLYDSGQLNQEDMSSLNKQLKHLAINKGRSLSNSGTDIVNKIKDKGGVVGKLTGEVNKLGKVKKALGLLGPAAAALGSLGVAEKTMAGDFKGALGEAYNAYMPEAIKPTELGNADFDPNMLNDPNIQELQKRVFAGHIVDDGAREGKFGEKVDQHSVTTINEKEQLEPVRMNRLRQILQQNK